MTSSSNRAPADVVRPVSAAAVTISGRRMLPSCPEEAAVVSVPSDPRTAAVQQSSSAVQSKSDLHPPERRRPATAAELGRVNRLSGSHLGRIGSADLGFGFVCSSTTSSGSGVSGKASTNRLSRGDDVIELISSGISEENCIPSTTLDSTKLQPIEPISGLYPLYDYYVLS